MKKSGISILFIFSVLIGYSQTINVGRPKAPVTSDPVEISTSTLSYDYYAKHPSTAALNGDAVENSNSYYLDQNCDCELYEEGVLVESNNQTREVYAHEDTDRNSSNFSMNGGGYVNSVTLATWNGSTKGTLVLDLNPSTTPYLTGGYGTTTSGALTYTSGISSFANAVEIALKNGLIANGYEHSNITITDNNGNPWQLLFKCWWWDNPTNNIAGWDFANDLQISYSTSGGAPTTGKINVETQFHSDYACKTNYVNPFFWDGDDYVVAGFGSYYFNAGFPTAGWVQDVDFDNGSPFYNFIYPDPVLYTDDPVSKNVDELSVTFNTTCTNPTYDWEGNDSGTWVDLPGDNTTSTIKIEGAMGGGYRCVVTCNEGTYTTPEYNP